MYLNIKKIEKIPYRGKVYNLAVEKDETYYANDILVHNCRSILVPIFSDEEFDGNFTIPEVVRTKGNFVELA